MAPEFDLESFARRQDSVHKRIEESLAKLIAAVTGARAKEPPDPVATPTQGWSLPPSVTKAPLGVRPESLPWIRLEPPRFNGENARDWICKIQEYYNYHYTPLDDRLYLIHYLFDYPASDWLAYWMDNNSGNGWDDFLLAVKQRFGPDPYEGRLATLRQTSSLDVVGVDLSLTSDRHVPTYGLGEETHGAARIYMNATRVRKPHSSTPHSSTSNLLTLSEAPSPAVPSATTARVNPPADEVGTMILEVDEEILDVGEENKLDALPLKEFVVATELVVDNVLVGFVPVEPAVTVDLISEQSCALDDLLEPELGQEHSSVLKHEDGKQSPVGQTYPHEVEPHFMAKARVMKTMFSNLMDEERQRVVKIYGRGDLGETTPARTIYNNRDLQSYAWAWVFIIQQFEPIAIFGKSYVQVDGMEDRIFDPGAFVGFGVIRIPYSVVASGGGLKADSATWNSRVSCLTQLGKDGEPFLLFRQMLSCGAIPSARCITTLLAACSSRLMQSYRKEIHVLAARREVSDDAGNGGDFAGNASSIEKTCPSLIIMRRTLLMSGDYGLKMVLT